MSRQLERLLEIDRLLRTREKQTQVSISKALGFLNVRSAVISINQSKPLIRKALSSPD